jgi:hypothetical protein
MLLLMLPPYKKKEGMVSEVNVGAIKQMLTKKRKIPFW